MLAGTVWFSRALESGPDHVWAPQGNDWARNDMGSFSRLVGPPRSGPLIFCCRFGPVIARHKIRPKQTTAENS
jgi:hypothetical protein